MRPGFAILTAGRLYGSSPCRCDSPAPNFRSTPLHILNPLIHTVVIAAAPISSPLSSDLCEDATPQLYTDSPAFDPSRCIASMRDGSKSRRDRSIPFAISLSVVRESAATPNALSRPSGHLQSIVPHPHIGLLCRRWVSLFDADYGCGCGKRFAL